MYITPVKVTLSLDRICHELTHCAIIHDASSEILEKTARTLSMPTLYIASDQERVGKTALSITIAHNLSQKGKKVALFKPYHSSAQIGEPSQDGHLLRQASNIFISQEDSWPTELPYSDDFAHIPTNEMLGTFRETTSGADISIVEGLSGLQGTIASASSRLANELDATVVVVIGYTAALTTDSVLITKEIFGNRLAGVVLNGVTKYKVREVKGQVVPKLEANGIKVLAVIPEDRRLLGISVGQLVKHLNGTFLSLEEKSDNLVEHFLIGGLILDWGVLYFERFSNKAVIVRGDRPDIQMATLGTPTSCIVLTGGHQPIQYVSYEAMEEEVPLIQVDADTLSSAAALESVQGKASFDHPLKREQFRDLISEHGNLEPLYQSLMT